VNQAEKQADSVAAVDIEPEIDRCVSRVPKYAAGIPPIKYETTVSGAASSSSVGIGYSMLKQSKSLRSNSPTKRSNTQRKPATGG